MFKVKDREIPRCTIPPQKSEAHDEKRELELNGPTKAQETTARN